MISAKSTVENYCFSQLENYCTKNLEIFNGWGSNLKLLYQSFHSIDSFEGHRIFSIIRESLVDTFRFVGAVDFKKNIVFLNKSKIQPAVGTFYEVLMLPYSASKKNFKDAIVMGNFLIVKESNLVESSYKTVLCKLQASDKPVKVEGKKKRQFELLPDLFCFHTKDGVKQILTFIGYKDE